MHLILQLGPEVNYGRPSHSQFLYNMHPLFISPWIPCVGIRVTAALPHLRVMQRYFFHVHRSNHHTPDVSNEVIIGLEAIDGELGKLLMLEIPRRWLPLHVLFV